LLLVNSFTTFLSEPRCYSATPRHRTAPGELPIEAHSWFARGMRGYTLMELMVTVALLAIMSAMTAVGLGPLQMRYRVRKAVDVTAQLLVRTRLRAIETGRCHQIEVLADGIPVGAGTPGDGLRVSRRRDADCESRPDPLALVEVE